MSSILNNQFKSVFREEDTNTIPEFSKRTQVIFGIEDVIKKIDLISVTSRLSKLNGNKSTGFDGIHPLVLKNCSVSSVCFNG